MQSAAEVGFDESRFVLPQEAIKKLACGLCHHAPKVDAQLLSCCGQSACAKCIHDCGQQGSAVRFPYCRQCAVVNKDRGYDDTLSLAVVRCRHSSCDWTGPYDRVARHEAEECEVGKLYVKVQEMERALTAAEWAKVNALAEADSEILALRAEVRSLEVDVWEKSVTIRDLEGQLRDAKEALNASVNDAAQRGYMIQMMWGYPTAVLQKMHEGLLPELPRPPVPSSGALCLARSRSRSPGLLS